MALCAHGVRSVLSLLAGQYDKAMWRCGPTQYMNGYKAETPNSATGTYLRDFFPSQPFRANKFNSKNQPVVVCTPSVKNAATGRRPGLPILAALGTLLVGAMLLWF